MPQGVQCQRRASAGLPVEDLVMIDRCSLGPLSPILGLSPPKRYVKNRILRINTRLLAGPAKGGLPQRVLDCETFPLSYLDQGMVLFCVQLGLSNLSLHDISMQHYMPCTCKRFGNGRLAEAQTTFRGRSRYPVESISLLIRVATVAQFQYPV